MNVLDTLLADLRTIMANIVIKYDRQAKLYETVEIVKESDRYVSAMLAQDTFHTYQIFDIDAVINAGITDISLAQRYAQDKYLIPDNKRDEIVLQQRKYIIENYEEKNNYYRMLAGLPSIENHNVIYLTPAQYEELGIDEEKPLHELSNEDIVRVERAGILAQIKAANPTLEYLNYLGPNSIPIIQARSARNFSILRMTKDISESLYEEFNNVYEQCREYFMTVLYIGDYGSRYDLYDNFMAMMMMFMTIQRLVANTFKYGIERDFYDLNSIQMMFEAYNVPFIENLPMEYQRTLVRNLNTLLRFKSTDKVLYDICSLLGFERINIYKYYLVKEHRMDNNENPIFAYKEVQNPDGSTSIVEDAEKMYNLYFQTVDLKERNLALALSSTSNRLDYDQVVLDDPYWWSDDDELKKSLYEREFNYVESKYLNMNIMYKLTEMLFEVMYIFRMLLDKKDQTQMIQLEFPKLFERKKVDLFDTTMFLCALIAKKNKLMGDIIATPTKALSVMGFNFKADFKAIRRLIRQNPDKVDPIVLEYIQDMNIGDADDINRLFKNVRGLNDFLVEQLGKTQDLETYRIYKKLYDALMITNDSEVLYKKSNGETAATFLDYLEDKDAILYTFVQNASDEKINEAIEHVLFRLNALASELKYLYILNDSNNVLLNAVITLIRFFKSYTTDLSSFNIMYLMNSRHYNMIKLLHDIKAIESVLSANDMSMLLQYRDHAKLKSNITKKELVNFVNTYAPLISLGKDEQMKLREDYSRIMATVQGLVEQPIMDVLTSMTKIDEGTERFVSQEKLRAYKDLFMKQQNLVIERFMDIASKVYGKDNVIDYDVMMSSEKLITGSETYELDAKIASLVKDMASTDTMKVLAKLQGIYNRLQVSDTVIQYDVDAILATGIDGVEEIKLIHRYLTNAKMLGEEGLDLFNKLQIVAANIKEGDKAMDKYSDILMSIDKPLHPEGDKWNTEDKYMTMVELLRSHNIDMREFFFGMDKSLAGHDTVIDDYSDTMAIHKPIQLPGDKQEITDWSAILIQILRSSKVESKDKLQALRIGLEGSSDMELLYNDNISSTKVTLHNRNKAFFQDLYTTFVSVSRSDSYYLKSALTEMIKGLSISEALIDDYSDTTFIDKMMVPQKDKQELKDNYLMFIQVLRSSKWTSEDKIGDVSGTLQTGTNLAFLYNDLTSSSHSEIATKDEVFLEGLYTTYAYLDLRNRVVPFDKLQEIVSGLYVSDTLLDNYADTAFIDKLMVPLKDKQDIKDGYITFIEILRSIMLDSRASIKKLQAKALAKDSMDFMYGDTSHFDKEMEVMKDSEHITDRYTTQVGIEREDKHEFSETQTYEALMAINDSTYVGYSDLIPSAYVDFVFDGRQELKVLYTTLVELGRKDDINLYDAYNKMSTIMKANDTLLDEYSDIMSIYKLITNEMVLPLSDNFLLSIGLSREDILKLNSISRELNAVVNISEGLMAEYADNLGVVKQLVSDTDSLIQKNSILPTKQLVGKESPVIQMSKVLSEGNIYGFMNLINKYHDTITSIENNVSERETFPLTDKIELIREV